MKILLLPRWKISFDDGTKGSIIAKNDTTVAIEIPGRSVYINSVEGSQYKKKEWLVAEIVKQTDQEMVIDPLITWTK